jgi:hypothetical protein
LETPGRELPGGWGREYSLETAGSSADLIATPVVPAPGTSASAPASIYEVGLWSVGHMRTLTIQDVNQVLLKVGSTAYAALPASLKEALSANPEHADKGKQPAGMPSSNRSSVAGTSRVPIHLRYNWQAVMFDNAKKQTTEVIKTLRDETKATGPVEAEHSEFAIGDNWLMSDRASLKGGPEGRRTSGDAPSLFGQVKEMFQEAYNGHPAGHPTGATGAGMFHIIADQSSANS